MSQTPKLQAIRGMNDILPNDIYRWEFLEQQLFQWLKRYGYKQIRTPILEKTGLFIRAIGEVTDIVEKEMYTFTDNLNDESLTLRPEGTASCVRAVLEHNLLYNANQRLFYIGPMFRHERPQKGRYRQFHQLGVETLGFADPEIDAELLVMTARLWKTLKLDQYLTLEINTLGTSEERLAYRQILINYFEEHLELLDEEAKRRLHKNPLRILDSKNPAMQDMISKAPKLLDNLGESSKAFFERVQTILTQAEINFTINTRLVRGLDYYNHTVFEWTTNQLGAQGTVCAGGRYDGLVSQLGGKPTPASGFAIGLERLLSLLELINLDIPQNDLDIYIVNLPSANQDANEFYKYILNISERLRDQNLNVLVHTGGGSFKSQFKKADQSGAKFALIIGESEFENQTMTIKSLRNELIKEQSEQQITLNLQQALEYLWSILKNPKTA